MTPKFSVGDRVALNALPLVQVDTQNSSELKEPSLSYSMMPWHKSTATVLRPLKDICMELSLTNRLPNWRRSYTDTTATGTPKMAMGIIAVKGALI